MMINLLEIIVNPPQNTFFLLEVQLSLGQVKNKFLFPVILKAEYVACSIATTFVISINRFIKDMELDITNGPVHIYYDN